MVLLSCEIYLEFQWISITSSQKFDVSFSWWALTITKMVGDRLSAEPARGLKPLPCSHINIWVRSLKRCTITYHWRCGGQPCILFVYRPSSLYLSQFLVLTKLLLSIKYFITKLSERFGWNWIKVFIRPAIKERTLGQYGSRPQLITN